MSNTYALYGTAFENLEKKSDPKESSVRVITKSSIGVEVGGLTNKRIINRQNSFVK
jgi:hypothetical protein